MQNFVSQYGPMIYICLAVLTFVSGWLLRHRIQKLGPKTLLARLSPAVVFFLVAVLSNDPWVVIVCGLGMFLSLGVFALTLKRGRQLMSVIMLGLFLTGVDTTMAQSVAIIADDTQTDYLEPVMVQYDQPASTEKNFGIVVAITVAAIVAGILYKKVSDACKKFKPRVIPPEDNQDEDTNKEKGAIVPPTYAVEIPAMSLYCPVEPVETSKAKGFGGTDVETTTEITFQVASDRSSTLKVRKLNSAVGAGDMVTSADFNAELASVGIDPRKIGVQCVQNGSQIDPSTSKLSIKDGVVTVTGYDQVSVTVECTVNMVDWSDLGRMVVPTGMKSVFTDSTGYQGQNRFYRLRVEEVAK